MNTLKFLKQPNTHSCGPTSLVIVLRSFGFNKINIDQFKARKNGYTRNLLIQQLNNININVVAQNFARNKTIDEFKNSILFFMQRENTRIIFHYKTIPEHPKGHFSPIIHADENSVTILDTSRTKSKCIDKISWTSAFLAAKYRGFIVFTF